MMRYQHFGFDNKGRGDIKKVKFVKFKIVVPTEQDKKELQAALEYMHDLREIDTDFIAVNQLVHEYEHGDASDAYTNIVIDPNLFKKLESKK